MSASQPRALHDLVPGLRTERKVTGHDHAENAVQADQPLTLLRRLATMGGNRDRLGCKFTVRELRISGPR